MNSSTPSRKIPAVNQQHTINDYWSARAESYYRDHMASARGKAEKDMWSGIFAAALGDLSPGSTIIDMGCGTGFLSFILADLGFEVFGVDASPGMLARARAESVHRADLGLPTARFFSGSATDAPSFLAPAIASPALTVASDPALTVASDPALTVASATVSKWLLWTLPNPVAALKNWCRFSQRIVIADGLWYPAGINPAMKVDLPAGAPSFAATYAHLDLPLAQRVSVEDYVRVFRRAGYEPQVRYLPETADLDMRFGLPAGHAPATQFLISASCPGGAPLP